LNARINSSMKRRICLISESLWPPFNEGMKVFVWHLARYLAARYDFLGVTNQGADQPELKVLRIGFTKTMRSPELARLLKKFSPETLVYLPQASVTTNSFLRAWKLQRLLPAASLILIGLQARRHSLLARWLLPHLRIGTLLVQGHAAAAYFTRLGLTPHLIPSGVDVEKYHPVTPARKQALRRKYAIPPGVFLLSHVGHLRSTRNTDVLIQAGRLPKTHILMIASDHATPDLALKRSLQQAGIDVRDDYYENIEEIYQMSDAYLFPVTDEHGAIGMPLTILEALACDTPVISSRFGDLQQVLPASPAICFFSDFAGLTQARTALARGVKKGLARKLALPYAWDKVFDQVLPKFLVPPVSPAGLKTNPGQEKKRRGGC
jgi:glycosyltransferase involved in cell wall biosynthesis